MSLKSLSSAMAEPEALPWLLMLQKENLDDYFPSALASPTLSWTVCIQAQAHGGGCALGWSLLLISLCQGPFWKPPPGWILPVALVTLLGVPTALYLCHFNNLDFIIVSGLCDSDSRPGVGNFFCKGLESKHFKFVGHLVSMITAQLCSCWCRSSHRHVNK